VYARASSILQPSILTHFTPLILSLRYLPPAPVSNETLNFIYANFDKLYEESKTLNSQAAAARARAGQKLAAKKGDERKASAPSSPARAAAIARALK
jgi:hypothetical protein